MITKIINNRVLTCEDFTPYKLRTTAELYARSICKEQGLSEVLIYVCEICNDYHILDEKPKFLLGN